MSLRRKLKQGVTESRKASTAASTDAFERLKAIADEGIIAFYKDDLAKKEDFSVIAVLRKDPDAFRLVHLKIFPQGTEYVGVTGYMKALGERIKTIHKFLVDQTGVGEAVLEEAKNTLRGIAEVDGAVLTAPKKQEILGYLKLMMQEKRVLFPYELDFLQELNVERFELSK